MVATLALLLCRGKAPVPPIDRPPPTEPAWVCRAALPKSAHPGAKKALAQIWDAEEKPHALAAVKAFSAAYGAKFPKAASKITAWPRSLSIRASS